MFNGRPGQVEGSNILRRSLFSYVNIIIWESIILGILLTWILTLIAAIKEIENYHSFNNFCSILHLSTWIQRSRGGPELLLVHNRLNFQFN